MIFKKISAKRGRLFWVFLFFVSCSRISCPWKTQTIVSCHPVYTTERYLFHPETLVESIEVEIIRSGACYSLYVNILYKPLEIEEKTIDIAYFYDETEFHTFGFIMNGGQRICFPSEVSQDIVQVLHDFPVRMCFDKYDIVVPPLWFLAS